jgi:hypothetical protein
MARQKRSPSYRIGYRLGSLGTSSGKRPRRTGPRKSVPRGAWIGIAAAILLVVIIGLANAGGSSTNSPTTTAALGSSAADDVTVDSCRQDPQSLDMVALGRIVNHSAVMSDYQLFITYTNGNGGLITSSKVQSFTNLAPGQTDEFNLTTHADGTVAGLTCTPDVSRTPSSG